jgi:ubiquinone/menaquinone biosynthesis C-methylase UbiE
MRSTALVLFVIGWIATTSAEEPGAHAHGHDATMRHGFESAEEWSRVFDSPERVEWQKPSVVIRVAGIFEGDTVADLGAGTGFFTQYLTRAVGDGGAVYAVDVEPEMLQHIRERSDLGPARLETILARPDDPLLPERSVDVVLVVNTWHHIDDRLNYLPKIERALAPGGRLAIVDWHEGDLPLGPPAGSKISRDELVAELEKAGWRLETESVALPYQYFLVFYPPPAG